MTNEQLREIIDNAPEKPTHVYGNSAYCIFTGNNKGTDLNVSFAFYPFERKDLDNSGIRSLADLREILALRESNEELTQWITAISNGHQQVPDWIKQSAKSLLVNQATKGE